MIFCNCHYVSQPTNTHSIFLIMMYVWLSSLYDQYVPSFNFFVFVIVVVVFMFVGNCLSRRDELVLIPLGTIIVLAGRRNRSAWRVLGRSQSLLEIPSFVLKYGDSINNQPNDNGPNAKLKSLYNVVKSAWILKYGTTKIQLTTWTLSWLKN